MQLIKFCKPEHNIQHGSKLQLGTLYGYRSIEDPAIRDEAEGIFELTIEFPEEIELDLQWANLLFQGCLGVGQKIEIPQMPVKTSIHVENMHIVRTYGDRIVLKRTKVKITRDISDHFIFCMSLLDRVRDFPFSEYQDFWSFPLAQADNFALSIVKLIFDQNKLNHFNEPTLISTAENFNFIWKHKKVVYQNRYLNVTPKNKPSFNELFEIISNIEFIKPEKFKHENEYRFVFLFLLNDGHNIFKPKNKNLLLNLNPISDFGLLSMLTQKINA